MFLFLVDPDLYQKYSLKTSILFHRVTLIYMRDRVKTLETPLGL